MYTIWQDNRHAYEEGSAAKLLTGLCNRKFGWEHRARVLSTPRGYSPVTMVTLICGHVSGRSLATQPETEERVDGAGSPLPPCAPGPPRHRGARVRAVGLRGNGGAVIPHQRSSLYLRKCKELPPWDDPINNRTKAKQVTNKLSEVTEFLAWNVQNQICKASCHTSKTIKRGKLCALLYEEIKPQKCNRTAHEKIITFRYRKAYIWIIVCVGKKCRKGGPKNKLPTPTRIHGTIHPNGFSFLRWRFCRVEVFLHLMQNGTCRTEEFPSCHCKGLEWYFVSLKNLVR